MRNALVGIVVLTSVLAASRASAEQLCDPAYQDCRAQLLNLIQHETVGIDVAFWFMEDARYSDAIVQRFQAGVPVRVLVDTRADSAHPLNAQIIDQLASAGIPIRRRIATGILHWKMMLFAGQGQVEFSGANYSAYGFVYQTPYTNFEDEAVMFSDEPATVHSFMERYDDLWTDTTSYQDYANVPALARAYPSYPIDPEMNFPPLDSYRDRAVAAYDAEPAAIDVNMFRITDRAHADAIIQAVQRGVPVRLITEQEEYRNPDRLWDAWNVDRLCVAGVAIRQRGHQGLNHEKAVVLHGQGMAIFGSSNWTSPSDQEQEEHNEFTTKPYVFQWFSDQFNRKWTNGGASPETEPFTPLPPDAPAYSAPANGATKVSATTATVTFDAGPFAHLYDIYLGTSSTPGLIASDVDLGPVAPGGAALSYQLPALAPGTTYYWKIVAKTMAEQRAEGPVWSFTTGGKPGAAPAPLPSPAPGPGPVSSCGADPSTAPAAAPAPDPAPVPAPAPQIAMWIDLPAADAIVREPFAVTGWAADLADANANGVDLVDAWAYPAGGAAPIFVGEAHVTGSRPDVGAIYGAQHTPSGYGLLVRGLPPGAYNVTVFAHSSTAGTFPMSRAVSVQIASSAVVYLDTPANGASVGQGFLIAGWAADLGAASGGGIDVVHVYAYPSSGAAPIFLGQVIVDGSRPDVGAVFGSQFSSSGFAMLAPALSPGAYRIVVYGRSVVAGTFAAAAAADVVVQ